jgi:hypothetical protein
MVKRIDHLLNHGSLFVHLVSPVALARAARHFSIYGWSSLNAALQASTNSALTRNKHS